MSKRRKEVSVWIRLCIIVLGAGFTATSTVASGIDRLCSGSVELADGQWAGYAVDAPFMKEKLDYRYAIVGTEADHFWLEYEAGMPMGNGSMIMKVLVPGWPYAVDDIKRAMMQMPAPEGTEAMPPMEMPPSSIQKDDLAEPIRMACAEAQEGVEDTVTVPAGTFDATRITLRRLGKDIWVSAEVPFGIVKLADAQDKGTVLTAYGDDAEPAITAEPAQVPGMAQP